MTTRTPSAEIRSSSGWRESRLPGVPWRKKIGAPSGLPHSANVRLGRRDFAHAGPDDPWRQVTNCYLSPEAICELAVRQFVPAMGLMA